ncbi:MAG: OmpA family protein [Methylococcaceae bacterium]|nr:OmpA family protein [Methylococcaceae bacterium]
MSNQRLKIILSLSLSLFLEQVIATDESRATLLDNNPGFCDMYRGLNGGDDMPDFCPPVKTKEATRSFAPATKKTQSIAFSKLINFEYNSSKIMSKSFEALNKLSDVLKYEKMLSKVIRIEGHTDNVGSAKANKLLSEKRALAVKHYLVKRGVEENRLQTVGYGFNRLYDEEHPEDGINRRVEFINLGD